MIALLFSFITFLTWGTGDIFTTIASRKLGSYNASFYGYAFGLLFIFFFLPSAFHDAKNFHLSTVLLTTLLAIVQLVGFFSYNEGLKVGSASLVGTIAGAFPALIVILSVIFFGERLTLQQIVSVIVIFSGLLLASVHMKDLKKRHAILNRGNLFAFIAMIGWAIYFTFIKIPVKESGFFWPSFMTDIVGTFVFLLFGLKRIKLPKRTIKFQSGFFAAFMEGLLLTSGTYAYNFAIGQGLTSIVAAITGAYPALFALLAYIIFKDPITHQQKFGMFVILLGIILLAYFN